MIVITGMLRRAAEIDLAADRMHELIDEAVAPEDRGPDLEMVQSLTEIASWMREFNRVQAELNDLDPDSDVLAEFKPDGICESCGATVGNDTALCEKCSAELCEPIAEEIYGTIAKQQESSDA